ncbi:outer membrane autotransporter [Sulfuricaulis limicola]|uniref:Outer membrane autotransporter n=1 Tax=Sulfuricaulis limicola TaxID=1620215 RepID=A0A1B4XEJ8_9GAMM|nr:VPLPA-CTERM sorting domain-containing protein [Sulfuricaulis limicola]BAV33203.1 outer membrane autotransporter [Sulfuricaulis limicola]
MNPHTKLRVKILRLMVVAVLSAIYIAPSVTSAATKYWIGGSDWWDVGTNWNPSGQPQNNDFVFLTQSDNVNRVVSYANPLYPSAKLAGITINAVGSGSITLNQSKDLLSANSLNVGNSGTGVFTQTGGTVTLGVTLELGQNSGSNGIYNLQNGSLSVAFDEYVGKFGSGTFTQSSGTNTLSSFLYLGAGDGSSGIYNLQGGSLNAGNPSSSGGISVGGHGTGVFNQSGGTNTVHALFIGAAGVPTGSSGTYNLDGTSNLSVYNEIIGQARTGAFNQNGGTHTITNSLILGYYNGFNGIYNLQTGDLSTTNENLGYWGTGTFNQAGGTHTVSNSLTVGTWAGSTGTYNLNGGTLSTGTITKGAGSSTLNIDGGTLTVGNGNGSVSVDNLNLGSAANTNGSHTLSGTGSITAVYENIGNSGVGNFTQDGGTHTVTNTLTLAANTGSTGIYNLNDGVLRANTITVNSGGTFNFNGGTLSVNQFNGDLANLGGTLAPGNSPGITNITGNYSQSGAGTFAVEIGGIGLGQFDMLNISGTATLDGTLNVSLFDWGSGLFTPQVGDSFDILAAQMLSGQFSTYNLAALGNGLVWNISYLTDVIDTTDIVRLSVVSAVPLPAAFWLFGSGLLGLIVIARKRKSDDLRN